MTSETHNGRQQPAEVGESTTLLVVDPPSSQSHNNNPTAAADDEVPAAQEAAVTSTSGNNGVSEEDCVVPQHPDSDEEGEHPTVSVVIDEDEEGVAGGSAAATTPQVDQSAPQETEEHVVSLPYQDHNYDMGRLAVRTNSSRDNNESFPIIEGLASYIGDEPEHYNNVGGVGRMAPVEYRRVPGRESVSSSSVEQMRIQHGFHPTVISTDHHHPGVVSSSRQFGGQSVVRTNRGADGYSPSVNNLYPGTRQVSIMGGQLPPVFNPRRVVRPSTMSDYSQSPPTLRASRPADGAGYVTAPTTRYTTLTPQSQRGMGTSPITNLTPSTTAAVMNDPSRAANDNAPAPFFIPSRGVKPISRNRISTAGRGQPLTGAPPGPSAAPSSTSFQQPATQISPRKVYQQVGRGGRAGENAANDMHTYVKRNLQQETPPDTSALDVVEEEEAQNAKFFQRQSQSLGATARNKQVSQYPAGQEPVKQHASPRGNEHLGTPMHLQQRSSPNQQNNNNMQPAGFRATQQSAVPSILQRGTRQVGTTPPEASNQRLSSSQDQACTLADQQSLAALKQAQRPRGRPRGQRNSEASGNRSDSTGSPRGPLSPAETKRQRLQQQQLISSSGGGNPNQTGIQGNSPMVGYSQAGEQDYNNHAQSGSPQRVVSQYPGGYAQPNPNGSISMPNINEMHQQLPPNNNNNNFVQQQQQQHTSNQPGITHQQAGSEHQYHQRLEDLAEVAQLSAQHPIFTSTSISQRPIYPIPVTSPPLYLTRSPPKHQQQQHQPSRVQQQQFHPMEHSLMPPHHLIAEESSSPYKTYNNQPHQFYSNPMEEHSQLQNYSTNTPQMQEQQQQPQFMAAAASAASPFANSDQSMGQHASFDSFSEQSTPGGVPPIAKQKKPKKGAKKGNSAAGRKSTASKTKASKKEDEWEGEDYVTRCFCGMTHNDEFMIECDRCNVWQHGVCLGINTKNVPDCYFCELCNPRALKHTKEQAIAIQEKKLVQQKRIAEQLKSKGGGKKAAPARKAAPPKPTKSPAITPRGASFAGGPAKKQSAVSSSANSCKKFVEITENQYSRGVRAFMQQTNDKGHPELLAPLRTSTFARQMFVASNVEGLVATLEVETGHPVIEYSGCFSLASEVGNKDLKLPNKHSFTLNYNGFTKNGQIPANRLFIDASKMGSAARFARRSCKPNTEFKHAIEDGKLHVVLVAIEDIDFSAEVTIPFDYDYKTSLVPVNCACSVADLLSDQEEDCEVRKFNRSLVSSPKSPSQHTKMSSSPRQPFSPISPTAAKGSGGLGRLSSASSLEGSASSPTKAASPKKEIGPKPKKRFLSKKALKKHKVKGFNFKKKKVSLKATKSVESTKGDTGSKSSTPRRSGRVAPPATSITQTNSSASLSSLVEPVDLKKHDRVATLQASAAEDVSGNSRNRTASQTSTKNDSSGIAAAPTRSSNRLAVVAPKTEPKLEEEIKSESPEETEMPALITPIATTRSSRTKTNSLNNMEEEVKKGTPSSEDKSKLSREDRKLQETLAAIERQEQREKQKQEKKDKCQDVKPEISSNKFKAKTLAEILKNKSSSSASKSASNQKKGSASFTSAAALSATKKSKGEEIGRKDNQMRGLVVTPTTGNKLYKRTSTGRSSQNNNDKEESPVRKKTRASIQQSTPSSKDKQLLSSVEAAELLTEMASGIGNGSAAAAVAVEVKAPQKTVSRVNIHAQLVELAELALQQISQAKTEQSPVSNQQYHMTEFCLGPDYPRLSPARPPPPTPPAIEEQKEASPPEPVSKLNTKAVKKLTIDEYKRRRSQAADASCSTPPTSFSSPKRPGFASKGNASPIKKPSFIPLLTSITAQPSREEAVVLRSPPLTTELAAPSLDELKRRIYGGSKTEKVSPIPAAPVQVPPTPKPVSQPRVSLEERLRSKFGGSGEDPSSSSRTVPAAPPSTPVLDQPPPPPPRLFLAPPPPPPPPVSGRTAKPYNSSSSSGRW